MAPVLVTAAIFLFWSVLGLATLSLARANTREPRIALSAPIVGSAVTILPLFALSNLGFGMWHTARPTMEVLLLCAAAVLIRRRPRIPLAVVPVLALSIVELVVVGRPFFTFGFDWIANANGDMAYYVLSASNLLHHGLQSPIDGEALRLSKDLATASQSLNLRGLRPGTQIEVSALSPIIGRQPVEAYMPLTIAVAMTSIFAAGALALQGTRKVWAASVAGAILVLSPMAAYGVMQQLTPQNWGLCLGAVLFAWLLKPTIYDHRTLGIADLVVIALLTSALFIVAFEVATTLALAYGIFLIVMVVLRRVTPVAALLIWGGALGVWLIAANTFAPRTLRYVWFDITLGAQGLKGISQFGYSIVPTAVPGFVGIRTLFSAPTAPHASFYVGLGIVLLLGLIAAAAVTAWRGLAAGAITVLGDAVLAVFLVRTGNDFGLFKLYMYVQPFLAAALAVWLAKLRSRTTLVLGCSMLAAVGAFQAVTMNRYVENAFHPVDLAHASHPDLLPKFRSVFRRSTAPVVTYTDNLVLGDLEASITGPKTFHVLGRDVFGLRNYQLPAPRFHIRPGVVTAFYDSPRAEHLITKGRCTLLLPSGSMLPLNRRLWPDGSSALIATSCGAPRNVLAFVTSTLGESAILPQERERVAFWQLVHDPEFPEETFAGFGRYALFQVLGPTKGMRMVVTMTTSPLDPRNDAYALPPAVAVGASKERFAVTGAGSARVISPPLRVATIRGQSFLVLDMGRPGAFPNVRRPGLTGLWGTSVLLDSRSLTSYVRDVSLISSADYATLRAPEAIQVFPADLRNPGLEYSGIFEDGWVAGDSYVILAAGPAGTLSVQVDVLPVKGQHLDVLLNGRRVVSRSVGSGQLTIPVRVGPSTVRRKVELRWTKTAQLSSPDRRQAAAHLTFVGVVGLPLALRLPGDLADPNLLLSGVFKDGWLGRSSRILLAGGAAGTLNMRAQVVTGGQRLEVRVNGRTVVSRTVKPGSFELQAPIPASKSARTVELRWARTARIAPNDSRHAAARLMVLGVVPVKGPKLLQIPADLASPGLSYAGIYKDGWAHKNVRVVLAGGGAGTLSVKAQTALKGQHVDVVVDGRTATSTELAPGAATLRVPLAPAGRSRVVELHFARVARIAPNDPRLASTLLQTIAVVAAGRGAPAALHLPGDLATPGLSYAGIYKDGWAEKDARVLLAGGPAATLVVKAQTAAKAQHVDVVVDGHAAASADLAPGSRTLRVPLAPAGRSRVVELHFARVARIASNDPRLASTLLQTIAVEAAGRGAPAALHLPGDLATPGLSYAGIYKDGWAQKDVRVVLAGGAGATLSVKAQTALKGQQVDVVVDGRTAASTELAPGEATLRIPLAPAGRSRLVELHFVRVARIAPNDPRLASTLLQTIAVEAAGRGAPTALHLPGDLAISGLAYAGIYKDGWAQKDVRVVLAGGAGATLSVKAQTALKGQHVDVIVDGRSIASRDLKPGSKTLSVPLSATTGPRVVELHFSRVAPIAANDPRSVATLLQTIAVIGASSSAGATNATPPVTAPNLRASLSASQEVPVTASAGSGTFTATLVGRVLRWRMVVSDLSGPVVAAVIRSGSAGHTGPRLIGLCEPCSAPATGTTRLTQAEAAKLRGTAAYVNVGTSTNPSGEIRGQLTLR